MNTVFIAVLVCLNCNPSLEMRGKSDKLYYSYDLCEKAARGWAIFAHVETGNEYGYHCEAVRYEPKNLGKK